MESRETLDHQGSDSTRHRHGLGSAQSECPSELPETCREDVVHREADTDAGESGAKPRVGLQRVQKDLPAQRAAEKSPCADENSGYEVPGIRTGDLGDDFNGVLTS